MKSYKTTIAGAVAALCAFLVKDESLSPVVHNVAEIVGYLATAAIGFFARDNNVSSEKAGAK